jgi:hypothetical protein
VRGSSNAEVEAAEARLRAAVRQAQPDTILPREVARVLAPQSSAPVILARSETAALSETTSAWLLCAAGEPAGDAANRITGQPATSEAQEAVLEIHISEAALSGKPGINPPLALRVQAQITLVRARDGQELYSCPVRYCSAERKFKAWASHDARLFRLELDQSYRQIGAVLAERLADGGFVPASRIPADVIAQE